MTSTSFQHASEQRLFIWEETGGTVEAKPSPFIGTGHGPAGGGGEAEQPNLPGCVGRNVRMPPLAGPLLTYALAPPPRTAC